MNLLKGGTYEQKQARPISTKKGVEGESKLGPDAVKALKIRKLKMRQPKQPPLGI